MSINQNRLRKLRRQKGMALRELADKSKTSSRQLARFEADLAACQAVRETTVNKIARALHVDPGVLTGTLPMPTSSEQTSNEPSKGRRMQTSVLLDPEVRLACALIKRRYGVNITTLLNAAPLMFVLLAELSLQWRQEKVQEIYKVFDQLEALGDQGGHLSFAFNGVHAIEEATMGEVESIEEADVFGKNVSEEAFLWGYEPDNRNPLADYLRKLAQKVKRPEIIKDSESLSMGALENFPDFEICEGDLKKVAGSSEAAQRALKGGFVRLENVPDELWAEDAAEQRASWLENQLPEEERFRLNELRKQFEEILDEFLNDDAHGEREAADHISPEEGAGE